MRQKRFQLNITGITRGKKASCRKALERITAGSVAFCTVLTLGISAIALETTDPLCGLDHEHSSACYTAEAPDVPLELAGMVLHKHNAFCYDSSNTVICPLPELEEHTHEDTCYESEVPESEPTQSAHIHTDACYTKIQGAQICTVSESGSHIHTDACYETAVQDSAHTHTDSCYVNQRRDLVCQSPEYAGHTHGSDCFLQGEAPVCGMQESEEHTHENSCYENVLICVTQEHSGHTHGDDCYSWESVLSCHVDPEKVLSCTEPVHIHNEACFEWTQELTCSVDELPSEEILPTEPEKLLICTKVAFRNHIHCESCFETNDAGECIQTCTLIQLEEHQHQESCLGFSADALLCETENDETHKHSYSCYSSWTFLCQLPEVPDAPPEETEPKGPVSDPKADLERPSDWIKTISRVKLTGAWSHDILAIAQSQLGYEESTRNFSLYQSGDKKGYTRYGQWYGIPYGDWCAMFASFCLNYAGITDFPLECNCAHWVDTLTGLNMYAGSDVYTPKPGDLVFFDHGRESATAPRVAYGADHVAIVVGIIPATKDTPAKLMTIEGNHDDCVSYASYELTNPIIIGYGILPDGPGADYSCALPEHTHSYNCYDEGENVICKTQEHAHTDSCRSRTFLFTDDNLQAEVTLTNAVSIPDNLSLSIVPVETDDESSADAMIASTKRVLAKEDYLAKDTYLFRIELMADDQPYQLPLGTQAEIQISFRKPIMTSADESALHTLMLAQKSSKSYRVTRPLSATYEVKDGSIIGIYLFTEQFSTFSVALVEEQ